MDGVNGVTQCPIAPNDYFVYEFNVTQYGSSWYHSHYSVQYADGSLGPITLHGPSSADFDEVINPPLIMTDWGHNSAFITVESGLEIPDILLNGLGNVTNYYNEIKNTTTVQDPYSITFAEGTSEKRKRYLLTLINTSFTRTFVFSIDNHWLQIASADFVPITPYRNTSVLIGVGQRYNVIVEANPCPYPKTSPLPPDKNYWMRTYIVPCGGSIVDISDGYERNGILRYNSSSKADPSSQPWQKNYSVCADEAYTSLHPIVPWQVEPPSKISNISLDHQFDLINHTNPPPSSPSFPLAKWALDLNANYTPMRVNYTDLTFFHLDNTGSWNAEWRVIPETLTSQDWVRYLFTPQTNGVFWLSFLAGLSGTDRPEFKRWCTSGKISHVLSTKPMSADQKAVSCTYMDTILQFSNRHTTKPSPTTPRTGNSPTPPDETWSLCLAAAMS